MQSISEFYNWLRHHWQTNRHCQEHCQTLWQDPWRLPKCLDHVHGVSAEPSWQRKFHHNSPCDTWTCFVLLNLLIPEYSQKILLGKIELIPWTGDSISMIPHQLSCSFKPPFFGRSSWGASVYWTAKSPSHSPVSQTLTTISWKRLSLHMSSEGTC